MDDLFSGSDYDFSDSSGSAPWDVPDYGGSDLGSTAVDTSDTGLPGIDYGSSNYSGFDGSSGSAGGTSTGGASGSGFNWSSLIGPALGAAAGYAKGAQTEAQMKEQEQLQEKLYAFQQAQQEQYYQAHGQQLAKSLGGYAQFQKPVNQPSPFAPMSNVQSPFVNRQGPQPLPSGPVNWYSNSDQQPPQGLLSYGY